MTGLVRPVDGASAIRTRLAWRRTALSTTAVALLTIRVAVRDGFSTGPAIAIALTVVVWVAAMSLAQRRIRAMASVTPRYIRRSLPGTALLIVGFAVLGIVLVAL